PAAAPNPASVTAPGDVGCFGVAPALPNPAVATTPVDGRSVPGRGSVAPAGTSNAPTLVPPVLISGAFAVGGSKPEVRTSRRGSGVRATALSLGKAPTITGGGLGADGIGSGTTSALTGTGSSRGSILAGGISRTGGGGVSTGGGASRCGRLSMGRGAGGRSTGAS